MPPNSTMRSRDKFKPVDSMSKNTSGRDRLRLASIGNVKLNLLVTARVKNSKQVFHDVVFWFVSNSRRAPYPFNAQP